MRGTDSQQAAMVSYLSPERRVPQDHPLRPIRAMAETVLQGLSRQFANLYSHTGQPLDPPGEAPPGPAPAGALHRAKRATPHGAARL